MRKIVLLCASGMSTSILVAKMKEFASSISYDCIIEAHSVSLVKDVGVNSDIVLLAPQVTYRLNGVRTQVSCPVEVIDMIAYGTMDGKKVINIVKDILGD